MKKNYIVITEFSFRKDGAFSVQSFPRSFTTEKRALEFIEAFSKDLAGSKLVSESGVMDEYGKCWDKVVLIETSSLSYYRIKVQGVFVNE